MKKLFIDTPDNKEFLSQVFEMLWFWQERMNDDIKCSEDGIINDDDYVIVIRGVGGEHWN